MMREALGSDAAHVRFVDVGAAYTRPARTLAAYHEVYARQLRKTPKLRAVADVQFGPDAGGVGPVDRLRGRLQPLLQPPPRLGAVLLRRQRHPGSDPRGRVANASRGGPPRHHEAERGLRGPRRAPAPPHPAPEPLPACARSGSAATSSSSASGSHASSPASAGRSRMLLAATELARERGPARRRRPGRPRRARERPVRLRDHRPRPRVRRALGRLPRAARGRGPRALGRAPADLADRVLPLAARLHRAHLALTRLSRT